MGQIDPGYIDVRRAAAASGEADALYELGLLYSTGQGVDSDYIAAHMWFNLAAMQGDEAAREERADLAQFMSGEEVAEAQRQAREWIETH